MRDGHFVKDFPLASGTPQAFWPALGFIGGREANAAPSADLVMEFANLTAVVACRPAFGRNQHLPYAEAGAIMRQIFTPKIEAKGHVDREGGHGESKPHTRDTGEHRGAVLS